jgi:hypothetical protein
MTQVAIAGAATLIAEISVAAPPVSHRVHQPRGLEHEEANLLDADARVGDPVPEDALLRDRTAEGKSD